MKIVVLSDTHIPRAAHELPARLVDEIRLADMVMHAGDFVEEEVYDQLLGLNKTVHAVCGNMDSTELRKRLNNIEKTIVAAGRFKIGLIHGYGSPRDLIQTVANEFTGVDAVVFGHSHAATNIRKNGTLFFNPGSPTDTVFAKSNTFGILEVTDKSIEGSIVRL